MPKNPKNWWKYLILTERIFIASERIEEFNEIFRKDVTYGNIKSHKKSGLHPSLEDIFLGKPQERGGGQIDPPPAV